MLPFVWLRGIPALRYQGEAAATFEAELRWDFTRRWSLVGFIGEGWTSYDHFSDTALKDGHIAGGIGFRYLLARAFRLRAGIDLARGPEDSAIYITVGNAWL
jgi:hemolysin activation/secretion protein